MRNGESVYSLSVIDLLLRVNDRLHGVANFSLRVFIRANGLQDRAFCLED